MKRGLLHEEVRMSKVYWLLLFFASHSAIANPFHFSSRQCPVTNEFQTQWAAAEHIYLGDQGALMACNQLKIKDCPMSEILRNDGEYKYSYGEIAALGDFYISADEIYYEKGEKLNNQNLDNIFACIDKQGNILKKQKEIPDLPIPGCGWVFAINTNNILSLVRTNYDHFGWFNMKKYVEYHGLAIKWALQARFSSNLFVRKQLFEKSLFYNGFADHFLSDAFSAGHVRVPRFHLKKWIIENKSGFLKDVQADIASLIFHDREGLDENGSEVGLVVQNSHGQVWRTHSDHKLHECTQDSAPSIAIPLEAIAHSFREILEAFYYGIEPESFFLAIELVPFPHYNSMNEKYKASSVDWLRAGLPLPLKILFSEKSAKTIVHALPDIFGEFRSYVEREANNNPELIQRLPLKYIEAFRKIN